MLPFPGRPPIAAFALLMLTVDATTALRVMTFNIWLSGSEVHDGLAKIAKHIKAVDPDIVALQEVETPDVLPNITSLLGAPWSVIRHCNNTRPDTAILTKHQIINGTYTHVDYGMRVKIQLPSGKQVSVWSLHLDYRSYGPYAAFNKLVTNESQIMAGEFPYRTTSRVHNMVQLLTSRAFCQDIQKSQIVPVIVAGLDWVEGITWSTINKFSEEWEYTIQSSLLVSTGWRVSLLVSTGWRQYSRWLGLPVACERDAMVDSFRVLYPDPVSHPGITWSTINKFSEEWEYTIQEPTDRIDFINYLGPLKPVRSETYCGSEPMQPMPNQWDNDYPSDHFAVITDFDIASLELKSSVTDGAAEKPDIKELDKELIRRLQSATDEYHAPTPMCDSTIYLAVNDQR